jgi:hypothetical protein
MVDYKNWGCLSNLLRLNIVTDATTSQLQIEYLSSLEVSCENTSGCKTMAQGKMFDGKKVKIL